MRTPRLLQSLREHALLLMMTPNERLAAAATGAATSLSCCRPYAATSWAAWAGATEAIAAYRQALDGASLEPERRFLTAKLAEVG
jgi:hypothetical protein